MATLKLTIRSQASGKLLAREWPEIDPAVARMLIDQMTAMIADMPGRHRVQRRIAPDGTTTVDIELNRPPPNVTRPTFAELFGGGDG